MMQWSEISDIAEELPGRDLFAIQARDRVRAKEVYRGLVERGERAQHMQDKGHHFGGPSPEKLAEQGPSLPQIDDGYKAAQVLGMTVEQLRSAASMLHPDYSQQLPHPNLLSIGPWQLHRENYLAKRLS